MLFRSYNERKSGTKYNTIQTKLRRWYVMIAREMFTPEEIEPYATPDFGRGSLRKFWMVNRKSKSDGTPGELQFVDKPADFVEPRAEAKVTSIKIEDFSTAVDAVAVPDTPSISVNADVFNETFVEGVLDDSGILDEDLQTVNEIFGDDEDDEDDDDDYEPPANTSVNTSSRNNIVLTFNDDASVTSERQVAIEDTPPTTPATVKPRKSAPKSKSPAEMTDAKFAVSFNKDLNKFKTSMLENYGVRLSICLENLHIQDISPEELLMAVGRIK